MEPAILKLLGALLILKRFQEHTMAPLERDSGLCRIELDILYFLMENPSFNTATDIIETNHFSKSHVSGALKHLEQSGYIRKFTDSKNRKITYLSLSDKAFDLAARVRECKAAAWKALLKDIPPENVSNMIQTLDSICENAVRAEKETDVAGIRL